MAKNKLLRNEFPKVRQITKNGNFYYEVDCRRHDWNGKKKFTFKSRAKAYGKAVKGG